MQKSYSMLGMMSGTSLDGIDLAYCTFQKQNESWQYSIIKAETIPYPGSWRHKLTHYYGLLPHDFIGLHNEYGEYLGKQVLKFCRKHKLKPSYIAMHGHTLMHQPEAGITFQLGSGAHVAAVTGIPVIADFRTMDVALGGQGAPLVPVGDKLLFQAYDYLLNLGGFANISYSTENKRIAYDISPVNMALNYFAAKENLPFDKDGNLGRTGKIIEDLLKSLDGLAYYKKQGPKSLGREWFEQFFLPPIVQKYFVVPDIMHTLYEHIAQKIGNELSDKNKVCLTTGGGAHNSYLMERLNYYSKSKIEIPESLLIDFKEALIFAFLGVLYLENEPNCLASVTGAKKDNIGGILYTI